MDQVQLDSLNAKSISKTTEIPKTGMPWSGRAEYIKVSKQIL